MYRTIRQAKGFTIVELLIVIIVIAILATITIVSYNGISNRAKSSSAQLSAKQGYSKVASYAVQNSDNYPADLTTAGLTSTNSTLYEYSVDNTASPHTFCLTATVSGVSYNVSSTAPVPASGLCPGHTGGNGIAAGSAMQLATSANCPSSRTMVADARDNHSYWVQKLADGRCWMMTNLGYAGGGTNTYGDTKAISAGGGSTSTTAGQYYTQTNANITTSPTLPSASTDGGVTNPQYGYFYNWCGAMGAQLTTAACSGTSTTPAPDVTISVCPAGWRLPSTTEFQALNTAVNGGSTSSSSGLLSSWYGQFGGYWYLGSYNQNTNGYYWSSTQALSNYANTLFITPTSVNAASMNSKDHGYSVRCIAN